MKAGEPVINRIGHHLRANVVAYIALGVALGGGGGYAIAATTGAKTITVCADKRSGLLYLHSRGRCGRAQRKVTWNQQGLPGPRGSQGPAGTPAVTAWAAVSGAGGVFAGHGILVQHASPGTYSISLTDTSCAPGYNAPTVSVSDGNPPAGQPAGAFAVAWVESGGVSSHFSVVTGDVVNGTFTPSDHTFDIEDNCS